MSANEKELNFVTAHNETLIFVNFAVGEKQIPEWIVEYLGGYDSVK